MTRVSVLMSAYNAEKYIAESIESILSQTFEDFEFIIIDDGSTDNTSQIIKSYNDYRIKYHYHKNQGLSKSLNMGLALAEGEYIIKLDSDDIAYKERIAKQVSFMDSHPDYSLCGGGEDIISEDGEYIYTMIPPSEDQDIRKEMEYKNSFVHSTMCYRKESALSFGGYYEDIKHFCEDYCLGYQLTKVGKVYNFPESFVAYRLVPNSLSNRNSSKEYVKLVDRIVKNGVATPSELERLNSIRRKVDSKGRKSHDYFLTLARLYKFYQKDYKKAFKNYSMAIKYKKISMNSIRTMVFLLLPNFAINKN